MSAQLLLAAAAAAAACAAMLWHERRRQLEEERPGAGEASAQAELRRRRGSCAAAAAAAGGIPAGELAALRAFVRRVHRWRGWQGGTYHVAEAWRSVEAGAARPSGGGWQRQFDPARMTGAACDALLRLIDGAFFGGRLLRRLAAPGGGQPLRCDMADMRGERGGWLAFFDAESNVVYLNRWRWAKCVSRERPLNCEGAVCDCRLQVLAHTLAHELVHAAVFHLFPDIDARSEAYVGNDRHGPVFHLLNKQLFRHSSNALEDARPLRCAGDGGGG